MKQKLICNLDNKTRFRVIEIVKNFKGSDFLDLLDKLPKLVSKSVLTLYKKYNIYKNVKLQNIKDMDDPEYNALAKKKSKSILKKTQITKNDIINYIDEKFLINFESDEKKKYIKKRREKFNSSKILMNTLYRDGDVLI